MQTRLFFSLPILAVLAAVAACGDDTSNGSVSPYLDQLGEDTALLEESLATHDRAIAEAPDLDAVHAVEGRLQSSTSDVMSDIGHVLEDVGACEHTGPDTTMSEMRAHFDDMTSLFQQHLTDMAGVSDLASARSVEQGFQRGMQQHIETMNGVADDMMADVESYSCGEMHSNDHGMGGGH